MMEYAQARQDSIRDKNARVSTASLDYRSKLQDKIDTGHKMHQKNRNNVLKKVVEAE